MLENKTIAVVVPCYNEERQIGMVLDTMPDFVDRIVVVNDGSTDDTGTIVRTYMERSEKKPLPKKPAPAAPTWRNRYDHAERLVRKRNQRELAGFTPSETIHENPDEDRIVLIDASGNSGVGAAIARGYKWCKDHHIDCTAVMAGDGQMDPSELESICRPVVEEDIDYVKGNRLIHGGARLVIPTARYFGNSILSILTKVASGYWHVSDTQTGYTAISKKALNAIDLGKIYKGYGMPNDMLVKLNIAFGTIKEVEIKPVYNIGEKSKLNVFKVILPISLLLIRSFFKRLWVKYLFRDFHPLFLLYHFSFTLGLGCLPYTIKIIEAFIDGYKMSYEPLLAFIFLFTVGFQSMLFAMWMDIQDNERLHK